MPTASWRGRMDEITLRLEQSDYVDDSNMVAYEVSISDIECGFVTVGNGRSPGTALRDAARRLRRMVETMEKAAKENVL